MIVWMALFACGSTDVAPPAEVEAAAVGAPAASPTPTLSLVYGGRGDGDIEPCG